MGKETDIWDDSALIKAFDNAIIKYQKMHYKTRKEEEEEEEEDEEAGSKNNAHENEPTFTKSIGASNEFPAVQNDQLGADFSMLESYKHASSVPAVQETVEGNTESQDAEYSQLLRQYYELEMQRQNVLQQLNQAYCWNYQTSAEGSGSCPPWNMSSASQAQLPTHCTSCPGHFSCCFTCCCHCSSASCSSPSASACAVGGQCFGESGTHAIDAASKIDPLRPFPFADSSIVKAATEAAERAVSSMKLDHSLTSKSPKGKANAKEVSAGASDGGVSQGVGLETDLSAVLIAWYSAGFYTGKYLSEQSLSRSRQ